MKDILIVILYVVGAICAFYLLGRFFMKGVFHEIDSFLGKKFVNYINSKKSKENDNEKKE